MLTNLDWIAKGQPFPPECEEERLNNYDKYSHMFNCRYDKVFGAEYACDANDLQMKALNVRTVLNYPQLLSKKTADFTVGEPPTVALNSGAKQTRELINLLQQKHIAFNSLLYQAMLDVSRFGNAVLKVVNNTISIVPPKHWFPVVDPYDQKVITHHVIAFVIDSIIYVEIHTPGKIERRRFMVEKGVSGMKASGTYLKFGDEVPAEKETESSDIDTKIDDFTVQVLSNVSDSESLFGISDYENIIDPLREVLWRIACAKRILDKHSAPSLIGTSTMFTTDPRTGARYINLGNFFVRDSADAPKPEYLTWDGDLEAVRKEIEFLINQIYILSEMGAAFLEGGGSGGVNSGRALRLRMVSPLIKAQRLVGINDAVVHNLIKLLSDVNNISLDLEDISLTWHDGLPNDVLDDVEVYAKATNGKAFMSQLAAVKRFNNMDDEAADIELAQIESESGNMFQEVNNNFTDDEDDLDDDERA